MNLFANRLPESVVKNDILEIAFNGLYDLGIVVTAKHTKLLFLKGFITCSIYILFTTGQFVQAGTTSDTSVMVVYGAVGFCLVSAGVRLFYFFIIRQKDFFDIVCDLDNDAKNSTEVATEEEAKIIKHYTTYARRLSLFLVRSSQFSVIIFIGIHLWQSNFNPIKTMRTSAMPPMLRSQWLYENKQNLVFLLNIFNGFSYYSAIKTVPNIHALLSSMTTFIVMNLRLLNQKLANLQDYITETNIEARNAEANRIIVECIKRHRYIKDFVNKMQEISGKFLFFDFIIYSVQLCFMLFQIVTATDFAILLFNVNYVSTLVAVLWLYYYHGNEIIHHSDAISQSVYMCSWYEFDQKFKKAMLQLMTSSYEPMKMYAGLIEVNIPNFIGIIKAGYSYMTVLRQRPA